MWIYLKAVGYTSTVAELTTFAPTPQSNSVKYPLICNIGMLCSIVDIPLAPIPMNVTTDGDLSSISWI